jgi:chromosome segregation ATPase
MAAAESALIAKQKADLEIESLRKELESLKALRAEIVPTTSASLPIAANYSSSAVLDDWGNDDGWETASPVEPQAELEYLRSFVRTKIQENDELKQQLSQRSEGDVQKKVIDPKSDASSLFATPSRLANSTSSITRTSSPALSMIPDTEAKDLFGDDGGWDDLEFEPISNSKASAPAQSPHANGISSAEPVSLESDIKKIEQLTSEIENLNTRLESLKPAERQNETLKKALGMRDQELTEITEQYNALNVECGDLKAQVETLEAELEEHRHSLEQATQQLQKAQQSSPMVRSTSTEDAQSSTLGAELTRAKATIHTLQTLLAAKPPSGSTTKDSSEENGWGDDFDDLEESKKPDIKSLENEIDALRHLGEQKDSLLSNLRLEIVSLNSTIATLESEKTSPKSHHEGESHEDVASRLAQAVEAERAHWTSKISDLDATHQKQLEELELAHLTQCEQLEATNAETLKSQLESALQTVRVEADKDIRRRIHEIEEIHASQKEILESKLAKVSLEKQEVEKEKFELQSRLTSKTDELAALNAKIQTLQSSVPDATILANLTQENHHLRGELEDLRRVQNGSNAEIMEELEQLRSARDSSESSTQALKESYQFELENVKQLQLDAEARMANYQNKALELSSTVDQLKADLKAKHDLLQQKEAQVVDLQARLQKERSSRDSTLMTAEETNLEVRDENSRLKSQLDQTRKSLQALRTNQDEQNQALNALRTQEAQSAAQIKLYLDRISQLQALLDKPAAPIVSWAEEQLVSQSAIAERLTTENLKLSKGLVSGLVDQQTPVERLASAKAQLQDRVDRLERDLKRIKGELAARTEERDSLRTKVDSLNSDKADLKRQLSASSSRLHSPAAHFAAYSSTPSSPYAYSSPSFAPGTPGSP